MRIVLGSENIPKSAAVRESFTRVFPLEKRIDVETVCTESGVSAHPRSAEESITGALNRAAQARELRPGADYYVGIEGGLLCVGERTWEIGWVAIYNSLGQITTGLSAGIEISGDILRGITTGTELNDILARDFHITAAGNTNGFYGIATDDLVTRQAAYEQGVTFALAQFLHPELYVDSATGIVPAS